MKSKIQYISLFFCLILMGSTAFAAVQRCTLQGRVLDSDAKPVIGASIYLPDLKTGTVTNADGYYVLKNLPCHQLLLQVSSLGFKMVAVELNPLQTPNKNFSLAPSVTEIAEVAVTGQAVGTRISKLPTPLTVVSTRQLMETSSTNIIDALSNQPGISQITTGSGISKPVIRGLGYNRVVVLNDGVRQEGQQWGDEHGIEINEFEINRIEILKGPASLMYGSDAMAGVINLFSAPVLPQGERSLKILTNYQTNNGLGAYSLNYAGHKNNFVWDMRYSNKLAHAYQNKYDGYVFNSGYKENAFEAMGGLSSWWGYSHLSLSAYHLQPGIVDGTRDTLSGKFSRETTGGDEVVSEKVLKSYNLQIPYQKVDHYKAAWNSHWILGEGAFKSTFAYQQNNRREYADVANPDEYGLYLQLHTLSYTMSYQFPSFNGYRVSAGLSGMYQQSVNKGVEFLVPDYHLFDAGLFVVGDKTFGKLDVSGGFRVDNRHQYADALYLDENEQRVGAAANGVTTRFQAFRKQVDGFSGSLGASYHPSDEWTLKLNVARGFRAPNISELGANGVHEGTLRYEQGNVALKSEQSTQLDGELGFQNEHITSKLNLFVNDIDHYIFLHKIPSAFGGDSILEGVPVYQFSAGHAMLTGGECYLDFHPHPWDWLHIENTFSYVHSVLLQQPDSMKYLPFTPPAKWTSTLRFEIRTKKAYLKNSYFSVGMDKYFSQKEVYWAYNTETASNGYMLWNASVGTELVRKQKTLCAIYLSATNLLSEAYQSHLSRLKYADTNLVTGREGVYNMGRNLSIKLLIPVSL